MVNVPTGETRTNGDQIGVHALGEVVGVGTIGSLAQAPSTEPIGTRNMDSAPPPISGARYEVCEASITHHWSRLSWLRRWRFYRHNQLMTPALDLRHAPPESACSRCQTGGRTKRVQTFRFSSASHLFLFYRSWIFWPMLKPQAVCEQTDH